MRSEPLPSPPVARRGCDGHPNGADRSDASGHASQKGCKRTGLCSALRAERVTWVASPDDEISFWRSENAARAKLSASCAALLCAGPDRGLRNLGYVVVGGLAGACGFGLGRVADHLGVLLASVRAAAAIPSGDWPTFGYDSAHSGSAPAVWHHGRQRRLAASAPGDRRHDGRLGADRAARGHGRRPRPRRDRGHRGQRSDGRRRRRHRRTAVGVPSSGHQSQVTDTTPVADPDRPRSTPASPDGVIHKLALATGRQLWARAITTDPGHEKMDSALTVSGPT